MLVITYDRSTQAVTVTSATLKTTPRELVRIGLLQDEVATTLATGETLKIELKPRNVTDADVIASITLGSAARNAALAAYAGEMNVFTAAALALLGINDGNAANDVATPVEVDAVVLLYPPTGEPVESDTFVVKLSAAKHLSTDASPVPLPSADDWLDTRTLRTRVSEDGSYIEVLDGSGTVLGKLTLIIE